MSGSLFLQELLRETGQKASKTKMKAIEDLHRKHFARKIAGIQPLPGAEDLARRSPFALNNLAEMRLATPARPDSLAGFWFFPPIPGI